MDKMLFISEIGTEEFSVHDEKRNLECLIKWLKGGDMIIDRKFIFKAVNPCNGKTYDQTNAIILCAKDKAAIPALIAYLDACKRLECAPEHIESIGLLIDRISEYQDTIEVRIPDTNLKCEIERCIEGKNL